jgi:hypothetical protein
MSIIAGEMECARNRVGDESDFELSCRELWRVGVVERKVPGTYPCKDSGTLIVAFHTQYNNNNNKDNN